MRNIVRYIGQAAVYIVIAIILGYFSVAPAYRHLPEEAAQVKISFAHGAKPKGGCRRLTSAEIADLAPNMRRPTSCPRERLPLLLEFELDGNKMFSESLPPTGLAGDGPSRFYRTFPVAAGRHHVIVRMRDSARTDGYDYEREAVVELGPRQIFVIGFKADTGDFVFVGAEQ
jgi:hypothetical protein